MGRPDSGARRDNPKAGEAAAWPRPSTPTDDHKPGRRTGLITRAHAAAPRNLTTRPTMTDKLVPAVELNRLRIAMAGMQEPSPAKAAAGPERLRVLHADDHPANRQLVQEILHAAGHHPRACCSGAEALEQLGHHAFDLVLMDVNMPGLSGIETVHRLRAGRGPASNIPVIALTSEIRRNLDGYRALGFDGFVNKPFVIAALLEEIARCAAAAPRPRARSEPSPWTSDRAAPSRASNTVRRRPSAPCRVEDPWIGGNERKALRRIAS
jgi:CheY-like chemotaxis protein